MTEERALIPTEPATEPLDLMMTAKALAASGFFPDVHSVSQAIAKILAGRELGFGPMASMRGVFVINGQTAYSATMIAAAIRRESSPYDFTVARLDAEACELVFTKHGKQLGVSTFTMADAAQADLLRNVVWKKYPRNMLFARALVNGARWYCSDILGGMDFEVLATSDRGDIIDAPSREIEESSRAIDMEATRGDIIGIHVLAREAGWIQGKDDATYRAKLREWFGVDTSKDLTMAQAAVLREQLANAIEAPPEPDIWRTRRQDPDEEELPPLSAAERLPPPTAEEWAGYRAALRTAGLLGVDLAPFDVMESETSAARLATLQERLDAEIQAHQGRLPLEAS